MAKASEPWSARQQSQLFYISGFTIDIRHVQGKENSVADVLSRKTAGSLAVVHLGIDFHAMAEAQKLDDEVQDYRTIISSLQLRICLLVSMVLLCYVICPQVNSDLLEVPSFLRSSWFVSSLCVVNKKAHR